MKRNIHIIKHNVIIVAKYKMNSNILEFIYMNEEYRNKNASYGIINDSLPKMFKTHSSLYPAFSFSFDRYTLMLPGRDSHRDFEQTIITNPICAKFLKSKIVIQIK